MIARYDSVGRLERYVAGAFMRSRNAKRPTTAADSLGLC